MFFNNSLLCVPFALPSLMHILIFFIDQMSSWLHGVFLHFLDMHFWVFFFHKLVFPFLWYKCGKKIIIYFFFNYQHYFILFLINFVKKINFFCHYVFYHCIHCFHFLLQSGFSFCFVFFALWIFSFQFLFFIIYLLNIWQSCVRPKPHLHKNLSYILTFIFFFHIFYLIERRRKRGNDFAL